MKKTNFRAYPYRGVFVEAAARLGKTANAVYLSYQHQNPEVMRVVNDILRERAEIGAALSRTLHGTAIPKS